MLSHILVTYKTFSLLSFLLLFFGLLISAQNLYYPNKTWEEKEPAFFGFDNQKIEEAIRFSTENENQVEVNLENAITKAFGSEPYFEIKGPTKFRGKPNGVIIKNGYIIGKWGDINRVDMTFSVTKSYLSAVTGIAVDKNLIRSEKDFVSSYVWDKTFDGEKNSIITWEHLLNQSSDWLSLIHI